MPQEPYIVQFTRRETRLLERAKALKLTLPEDFLYWQLWIGDPEIYLNRLRNFIEDHETQTPHHPTS